MLEAGQVQNRGNPKDVVEDYLARTYEEQQGAHAVNTQVSAVSASKKARLAERDMRLDFINTTRHRNDIELFAFDPAAMAFGKGGATITSVVLADEAGAPLSWIVGGALSSLVIRLRANEDLDRPIVGFYVKDHLGQCLFGDNTFLSYRNHPLSLKRGQSCEASFHFRMPILPAGDYSVCVAVAAGTQAEHVQHHWMHDALLVRSHSSSESTGLVGIPMTEIKLMAIEELTT